ncbi:hypothetical protein DCAR_0728194 [Daucus carota subsp. sativus]|uniref:Uncharacterized protein n=1 Tax=Daucus carota subsp. sativus TaxID=79200 RepID=A0AAF0XLP5_DAUCS|nr:hypothetical protein DCAR_0728194 [Daucus carota subsp. sativus]
MQACDNTRGKAIVQQPNEMDGKPKKTTTYLRYLQKKFSPEHFTNMIVNLSEAQSNWVKKTGFEHLLHHRNMIYPHRVGYNIMEAFNSEKCALILQAGMVVITERLVHNVMGLPLGEHEIKFKKI